MQRLRVPEMEISLVCGLGEFEQKGKIGDEFKEQDRLNYTEL